MVGADLILAYSFGKVPCYALGHAPRIDEDKRRAMRLDEVRQAIVDLIPDLGGHYGFERRRRNLEGPVPRPAVSCIDDRTSGGRGSISCASEEPRNGFNGFLRCGEANPLKPLASEGL